MAQPPNPERYEFLQAFDAGMNNDVDPLLLERNQASLLLNTTVRGTFAKPRPPWRKIAVTYPSAEVQAAATQALFQEVRYYDPDSGAESLITSVAGRLFKFVIGSGATAVCSEQTGSYPMSATAPIVWLEQAENYMAWTDGVTLPTFWNGTTGVTTRSAGSGTIYTTTTTALISPWPALFADTPMPVVDETNMTVGDILTLSNLGAVVVKSKGPLVVTNQTIAPGTISQIGVAVTWQTGGFQFPIGTVMAYGMGRLWMALADRRRFIAGDAVGGSSGTVANEFRDAILYIRENNFLLGGGFFIVPGDAGEIRAMRFAANLDAALGQGPLQIYTIRKAFSVISPTIRTDWTDVTNPILRESLIANGAMGQDSTQLMNSDTLFRSIDGKRSLILARRDFDTWGNTPISREVSPIISPDNPALLEYESSVFFDNRELSTYGPVQSTLGVYHNGLIALNGDPISSLRGKAPSIYDGAWSGPKILKITKGEFGGVERCFAFCLNDALDTIELWELMKSETTLVEDDGVKITWDVQSASLFNRDRPISLRDRLRLTNGEIFVSDMIGPTRFSTFYRPDQWSAWIPWLTWIEFPKTNGSFRPRMGLGEPSPLDMDEENNRPLREAYNFQFRCIVTGHCVFKGARFKAVMANESDFANPRDNADAPFDVNADHIGMANAAQTASFMIGTATNSNGITIPANIGSATPYPSTATLSGTAKTFTVAAGTFTSTLPVDASLSLDQRNALINAEQTRLNTLALDSARTQLLASIKFTLAITGFTHTSPDDVQIMLSSPGGVKVTVMRHCGGSNAIAGVNLTFDDAFGLLPASTIITTGTYAPTQNGSSSFSVFPGPPSGTEYDKLSTLMTGEIPGTWNLWVIDVVNLDGGSISAWQLTIT